MSEVKIPVVVIAVFLSFTARADGRPKGALQACNAAYEEMTQVSKSLEEAHLEMAIDGFLNIYSQHVQGIPTYEDFLKIYQARSTQKNRLPSLEEYETVQFFTYAVNDLDVFNLILQELNISDTLLAGTDQPLDPKIIPYTNCLRTYLSDQLSKLPVENGYVLKAESLIQKLTLTVTPAPLPTPAPAPGRTRRTVQLTASRLSPVQINSVYPTSASALQ